MLFSCLFLESQKIYFISNRVFFVTTYFVSFQKIFFFLNFFSSHSIFFSLFEIFEWLNEFYDLKCKKRHERNERQLNEVEESVNLCDFIFDIDWKLKIENLNNCTRYIWLFLMYVKGEWPDYSLCKLSFVMWFGCCWVKFEIVTFL